MNTIYFAAKVQLYDNGILGTEVIYDPYCNNPGVQIASTNFYTVFKAMKEANEKSGGIYAVLNDKGQPLTLFVGGQPIGLTEIVSNE